MSPAFQFYPAEFLSDENVALMNNRELGCYVRLICFCWREGSIPAGVEKIARLCGEDSSAMAQLWLSIKPCFIVGSDPSRLIHPRLEKERVKQKAYALERAESGRKGAKTRWKLDNSSAIKQPLAINSSSSSSSSSLSLERDIPRIEHNGHPTIEDVVTKAQMIGLARWKAEDWYHEMNGGGWLDYAHRPIADWASVLTRVKVKWEADGRPAGPPARQQPSSQRKRTPPTL